MNHLVIYNKKLFHQDYIALILNGDKVFGFKFRKRRTTPYQKIKDGDYLYLKESSGPILGRVRISHVVNMKLTDPEDVMEFLVNHFQEIGIASEERLVDVCRQNISKQYLCHWRMEEPEIIKYPVFIQKKSRQAWVLDYEPDEEVRAAFL